MSVERERQALKELSQIAAVAGVSGRIDEEENEIVFDWPLRDDGHGLHEVRVFQSAEVEEGRVVSFEVRCWTLRKGDVRGFVRKQAAELLRLNADVLPFARFGMRPTRKDDSALELEVVASVDHLLGTLDAEEFRAAVRYVAEAADSFLERFTVDA